MLAGEKIFFAAKGEKINTNYGIIDTARAIPGKTIKSALGYKFMVLEPTLPDLLRKCRRGPQIITPKDAAQVVAATGVCSGWRCLDAGGGSGFMSLFLGNTVKPGGRVYVYEREKRFAGVIKHNIKLCGMEHVITLKNKDALKGFSERKLDLVTLDMIKAEQMVKKAYTALKAGGWLCVYSPHIEQQKKVVAAMDDFSHIRTVENMQREWQVEEGYTHPRPSGILHTGFMTFGRKM